MWSGDTDDFVGVVGDLRGPRLVEPGGGWPGVADRLPDRVRVPLGGLDQ